MSAGSRGSALANPVASTGWRPRRFLVSTGSQHVVRQHLVKRYRCTGETPNMVRRQRGAGVAPGSLVPCARTPGQRRLEAAVLEAANRTMAGMRRLGRALRPTSLVSRVRPDAKVLGLRIHDLALDHLLAEVLPVVVGGRVRGVPGLRVRPRREHLELRSADGEVRLLGVTRERWRQAVATGLPVSLATSDTLDPRERAPRPGLPADLMSGVLRRLPLWRGAAWLDGVVVGDGLELYWRGGPPSESIAAILAGSACGIPASAAVPHRFRDSVHGLVLSTAADAAVDHPEPEWAWDEWVATTAPGPAVRERAVQPADVRPDLPDVWEEHEVRAALASRDITTVYRLLLRHGVPRARIATLTGQSPDDVDRAVTGARVESYDTLVDIATGLGIPLGYMGLAHDEPPPPVTRCHCEDLDERTKRDRFLAHAALVAVGSTTSTWGCHARNCNSAHPV